MKTINCLRLYIAIVLIAASCFVPIKTLAQTIDPSVLEITSLGTTDIYQLSSQGFLLAGTLTRNLSYSSFPLYASAPYSTDLGNAPAYLHNFNITVTGTFLQPVTNVTIDIFNGETVLQTGGVGIAYTGYDQFGNFFSAGVDSSGVGTYGSYIPLTLTLPNGGYITSFQSSDHDSETPKFGVGIGSVEYTVIPEPSTYAAILGAVTMGIVAVRRRRVVT